MTSTQTGSHVETCSCGWTCKPTSKRRARERVRRHAITTACPDSPNYVPPAERRARELMQSMAAKMLTLPPGCAALAGDPACSCPWCKAAAVDENFALERGRWVARKGVRVWEEAS